MAAWIFQAIPDDYNLPNALRAGIPQVWRAKQRAREFAIGDRVFLWEGGSNRGIVAVARIAGPVEEMDLPESELAFVVAPTATEKRRKFGRENYVPLTVERVLLPARLPATRLKPHPKLAELSILKMAQGTNFGVRPDLEPVLEAFVAAWPPSGYV